MNKLIAIFFITIAFFPSTQKAHATTITFNEPGLVAGFGPSPFFSGTPKGTVVTDQLAALGVLFSMNANGVDYISSPTYVGGLTGPSGDNVFTVNTLPPVIGAPAVLTATFIDPSGTGALATIEGTTFSVFVSDTDSSSSSRVIVRTFGLDGSLLETQSLTTLGSILNFSVGQIARVEFIDNGSDGHTIDDFTFGRVSAVPEPSTLLLLGSGLMGLVVWRQKRAA